MDGIGQEVSGDKELVRIGRQAEGAVVVDRMVMVGGWCCAY